MSTTLQGKGLRIMLKLELVRMLVLVRVRMGMGMLKLVLVLGWMLLVGLGVVWLLVVDVVERVVFCVGWIVRAAVGWMRETYGSRDKGWD